MSLDHYPSWLLAVRDLAARGDAELVPARDLGGVGTQPRDAAVLIALSGLTFDDGTVLLQERGSQLRNHPGQVSFPGGRREDSDTDASATALREAHEEVGLDPSSVQVMGVGKTLPVIVSRFNVTPVFGFVASFDEVRIADAGEVAHVAAVPIAELVDPANRGVTMNARGNVAPAFEAGGLFVWGFTAMMLDGLIRQVGWHRDYDTGRYLEIPHSALSDRRPRGVK
ncbi:CoA pyrophosphatase [Micrococcales bacterium 31B]|nr:CoA pyrophosphatase [Micrococcales bacterium 31B]